MLKVEEKGEGERLITAIKQHHLKVEIALDLNNDINEIVQLLASINLVTLMAIKPGFTGQQFDPPVYYTTQILEIAIKQEKIIK